MLHLLGTLSVRIVDHAFKTRKYINKINKGTFLLCCLPLLTAYFLYTTVMYNFEMILIILYMDWLELTIFTELA